MNLSLTFRSKLFLIGVLAIGQGGHSFAQAAPLTDSESLGLPVIRCFATSTPQNSRDGLLLTVYSDWSERLPEERRYLADIGDMLLNSSAVEGNPLDRTTLESSTITFKAGPYTHELILTPKRKQNGMDSEVVIETQMASGRSSRRVYPNCLRIRM